ncbi:STAS domain-containing protein [Streptomyces sp. DSM 44917]|uniref:STAS domain-containing protein n=1 Tax=Streptomyces boetiae TaxID=3075541 RepID=A0ABU2L5C4_9ACTN|nr:STAS domain-containing protein [Streptomyces sp. DSM 44917]MDT0306626.1 STAS domain-containing protein [Streptomyces sp. DSM 44917]
MPFDASVGLSGSSAVLHLSGRLTDADVRTLRGLVEQAVGRSPRRLVVDLYDLEEMVPAALRCLAFAQQHLPATAEMVIEGASEHLRGALERSGLTQSMTVVTAAAPR